MVSYLNVQTKTQFPIFNFHLKFPCYPLQPKDYQQVFIIVEYLTLPILNVSFRSLKFIWNKSLNMRNQPSISTLQIKIHKRTFCWIPA